MRVTINGNEIIIPSSLAEFTLGQRIAFQEEYGNELDEWLKRILAMEDGIDRELEAAEYQFEKMFRTFAFFAGCTPDALKDSEFIDSIAGIYYASLDALFDSEKKLEMQQEYVWKGEVWYLHPPQLKHGDHMKFGEFIDAKQVVKNLADLGQSQWKGLLNLCAIYLRKKEEEYDESFLYDGSERLELFKNLPMDIALGVGFFLTASMNLYINHIRSSSRQKPKEADVIQPNTSINGGG